MARARSKSTRKILIGVLIVAALLLAGRFLLQRRVEPGPSVPETIGSVPLGVPAANIDPANEGREVSVSGVLHAAGPVRDTQLGIAADGVALIRDVRMLQWREQCSSGKCDYALEWSSAPIDSHAFREPRGHANDGAFPFTTRRFVVEDLRLGAFRIDPAAASPRSAEIAYPVQPAQLPPNLAATFRAHDGVLLADADPAQATSGDLSVSYRIVPLGPRSLIGVQHGDRLDSVPMH